MPFLYADRVRETSTSTGTGTFALAGAVSGFRTFASGIGANNTCYYTISHRTASEWEVGYGTLDSLGATLTRTAVQSSSTGSAVAFSSGTKDVFVTIPAAQAIIPTDAIPGGRLTLSSTDPLPSSDVTAQTTLYYLPFTGNKIMLYDGNQWVQKSIGSSLSMSLSAFSANLNYDIFAFIQSNNAILTYNGWSTDTARVTGLSMVDGIPVLSSSTSYRYLGTIRTTSAGQCSDTQAQRYVWNYYHRTPRPILKQDGTASWTYASTTYQYARAQSTNRIELVNGYAGSFLNLMLHTEAVHATAGQGGINVLSYDSNNSFAGLPYGSNIAGYTRVSVANQRVTNKAVMVGYPAVGYHYIAWLERIISTGTTTFYGTTDATGIQGWWEC
jgi:hypothetical protein